MKIKLDVTKSLEKNAEVYFEKSKKAKRKLEGARNALDRSFLKLEKVKKDNAAEEKDMKQKVARKKQWYEKFRWFFSSEGFLCVGGRDATTNEIVVKKHMDKDDLVFHTNMSGSPFFIIKSEGKEIGKDTINETAQATASYSSAWKAGMAAADVFYVKPEQVTKEAKPGEFVPRGAFMIYGKKNELSAELKIAIGVKEGIIIGGPPSAIKKQVKEFVLVGQGNEKSSDVAKKIKKKLNSGELDEIIRMLPAGGCKVLK